ncbi:MAG: aminopeptidase P N-terminal domain-containing protein [Metallibacterium sp.]
MSAARPIGVREYARRRRELMRMAGADAAILLAAAPPRLRNGDTTWPYRQDSDFLYLSGFDEPAAVLALLPGRRAGQSVLFCREREPAQERWDGAWRGPEGAVRELGLDDAFPFADIDDILPGMLEGRARLYCHFGREAAFDAQLLAWLRRLRATQGVAQAPQEMLALGHLLHELRLFKSPAELGLLRHAASIGMDAHRVAWAALAPGVPEFAIEADFVHALRRAGALPSYPPIVAGGRNACVLHYARNDAPLRDGDLLLLDAGAEWQGYASDITRTLPVNGRFNPAQRALYQLVLDAQRAALAVIRPGQGWEAFHQAARDVLIEGLCALGLLKGTPAQALASGSYRRYFPHKTGHWLGLDVHDAGDYRIHGEPRLLEPGMVLTVEPGVYVAPDERAAPPRYRGTGIRIEDDVVVTATGAEVLTAALPKDPDVLEDALASARPPHSPTPTLRV